MIIFLIQEVIFISMGCIIGMDRYKINFKPRQMKCTFVAEKGVVLCQRRWNVVCIVGAIGSV